MSGASTNSWDEAPRMAKRLTTEDHLALLRPLRAGEKSDRAKIRRQAQKVSRTQRRLRTTGHACAHRSGKAGKTRRRPEISGNFLRYIFRRFRHDFGHARQRRAQCNLVRGVGQLLSHQPDISLLKRHWPAGAHYPESFDVCCPQRRFS